MKIKVFSSEGCVGCKTVKTMLDEMGIEYEVKDIMQSDVMEEAATLGIRGIPVTVFEYEDSPTIQVVGSSQQALSEIKSLVS